MIAVEDAFATWLKTRPKNVQDFAVKHSLQPGDTLEIDGNTFWFLGYGVHADERVGAIVTSVNPSDDYDQAVAQRKHISADCFETVPTTF